ncbi:hypothetical protein CONLIGDRAFT_649052 [Coniochaeta ligniaria NRRL 30616]|uniref:Uncharacterized protein n=1 Tax=Coniochaeta ligniaria NRRL 30616 TaxID=1408157 RepID=A0A1J7J3B0_9PEZI|nr:hypothetical protein CONLIGDRAFT_649052 [Coniochaeta ligniaria NRRL 30616]
MCEIAKLVSPAILMHGSLQTPSDSGRQAATEYVTLSPNNYLVAGHAALGPLPGFRGSFKPHSPDSSAATWIYRACILKVKDQNGNLVDTVDPCRTIHEHGIRPLTPAATANNGNGNQDYDLTLNHRAVDLHLECGESRSTTTLAHWPSVSPPWARRLI